MSITDSIVEITYIGNEVTMRDISGRMVELDYGRMHFLPDDQYAVNALLKYLSKKKDWYSFFEVKNEWLDLRPVYSSTVHKSQGSTYDTVFINLSDIGRCNIASDVARMLYVAITRARNQVVLYGELPLKYRGVRNETTQSHQTAQPVFAADTPGLSRLPVLAA